MKRRKTFGSAEVNLTSLLDVLFCILFIVLITGMKGENVSKEKIDQLENQISNYKTTQEETVIIDISNLIDSSGNHILHMYTDSVGVDEITLRKDNLQNTNVRIEKYVSEIIESNKNHPVYIVFNCDKSQIYKKEFDSILGKINSLVEENKEVFVKVKETSNDG